MKNNLRVRRGAVVFVSETSANADDLRRNFLFAQHPARDVHLVNALVADVAVPGFPNPMPIVMKALAHQGVFRRGAAPQVIIDRGRDGLRTAGQPDAWAAFIAKPARTHDFAEIPSLHPRDGFLQSDAGTALRPGLNNPIMFARGFDDFATRQ